MRAPGLCSPPIATHASRWNPAQGRPPHASEPSEPDRPLCPPVLSCREVLGPCSWASMCQATDLSSFQSPRPGSCVLPAQQLAQLPKSWPVCLRLACVTGLCDWPTTCLACVADLCDWPTTCPCQISCLACLTGQQPAWPACPTANSSACTPSCWSVRICSQAPRTRLDAGTWGTMVSAHRGPSSCD